MIKKWLLIAFLFFISCPIVKAQDFNITGKNVILYNLNDNEILYEKLADEKVQIASLTKIMTTIVAIENIEDLNGQVVFSKNDFKNIASYSQAGFKVGDKVTYLDLLYGVILPSGADAVNALVNNTLGFDDFVSAMNSLAKKLEMNDTSFSNAIGRDNELNYSTAKDISKLLIYALSNETFKEIFTTKEYITSNNKKLESTLNFYKDYIEVDKIDGSKSGYTKNAGKCLASIANFNDVNYLLVVLNSSKNTPYSAIIDSLAIYDYYEKNYSYQTILEKDDVVSVIPIEGSSQKEYKIKSKENVIMYLKNNIKDNLNIEYTGVNVITQDTKDKLGVINIYEGKELLYQSDVYLEGSLSFYSPSISIVIGVVLLVTFLIYIIVTIFTIKSIRKAFKNN